MRIEVSGPEFLAAVEGAAAATARRPLSPVMANVLLAAQDGKVTVRGADNELGVTRVVADGVAVIEDGVELVDPVKVISTVKLHGERFVIGPGNAGAGLDIVVTNDAGRVKVRGGILGMADSEVAKFPVRRVKEYPTEARVDAVALAKLLKGVAWSAEQKMEVTRTEKGDREMKLKGVALSARGGKLMAEAMDGHRYAAATVDLADGAATDGFGVLLPLKAVTVLLESLDVGGVVIRADRPRDAGGGFEAEGAEFVLNGGQMGKGFPNMAGHVPKGWDGEFAVDAGELLTAIRTAQVCGDTAMAELSAVDLTCGDGLVVVEWANGASVGRAEVAADCSGEDVKVRTSPLFLVDFLRTFPKGGRVGLRLCHDEKKPMVLVDGDDRFFMCSQVTDRYGATNA